MPAGVRDWKARRVDGAYLVDSGLLFEINRSTLHLVGISMFVNPDGSLGLRDSRSEPEKLWFSDDTLKAATLKLRKYMAECGSPALERRRKVRKRGCQ